VGVETGKAKTGWLRRNVANLLTITRLLLLPFIVWTYSLYAPGPAWPTAAIVVIAALSDTADGVTARHLHTTSRFGRWVDPLIDRIFFVTIFVTLWYYGTLPWIAVLPLLARDAVLLILAVPFHRRTGEEPTPSRLGKAANPILVCALVGFIIDLRPIAWAFYGVGATLYIVTALQYGYHALAAVRAARGGSGERQSP
jgi:phosphatidylglycerophosphate synthase